MSEVIAKVGDNSANAANQLVLSAGTMLDRFGASYRVAERDQSIAWQCAIAVCYKMCEIGALLPAYEVDGKTPSTGPANLSLNQLRAPDTAKSAIHNGLAYFVAHYLDCDLTLARVMIKFLSNLARRGYTLADWNGQIVMDGESIVDVAIAPVLPGTRNEDMPGCWRLRLVDVASASEANLSHLPDTAENPITVCEMTKASTGAIMWRDTDQTRICLASDRAYSFRYGPDLGNGIRAVAKNVRIGRTTFNTVAQAVLAAEAQAVADAAAAAKKAIDDAAAEAARAKGEGTPDEAQPQTQETITDQRSDAMPGEGAKDTDKAQDTVAGGSPVGAEANKDDKSQDDDKDDDDNTDDKDDDKVATDKDTQQQMRVAEDRTRDDKEKLANGMTPEKIAAMFCEAMTPGRLNDSSEARAAFTRVFVHCVGVLKTIKAPTADALLKAATAKTVSDTVGKAFIQDDTRRNA